MVAGWSQGLKGERGEEEKSGEKETPELMKTQSAISNGAYSVRVYRV